MRVVLDHEILRLEVAVEVAGLVHDPHGGEALVGQ
jgi:hypothetical protein